jgi:hypothetical protein
MGERYQMGSRLKIPFDYCGFAKQISPMNAAGMWWFSWG